MEHKNKFYHKNQNVEADVHRCYEILTKGLGHDVKKIWYPSTYVSEKGCSGYDPRLRVITITPDKMGNGWTLAEEASHFFRDYLGRCDAEWRVEEFYGRLGARLVDKLAGKTDLRHLFENSKRSTPQKLADEQVKVLMQMRELRKKLKHIPKEKLSENETWMEHVYEYKELDAHRQGYAAAEKADLDLILKDHKDIFSWPAEKATRFVEDILENN